ncbi:MAG: VWA domain-containing protein [Ignavibacteriaceae bacterium]
MPEDFSFAYPWVLWFLILIPLMIFWYIFRILKQRPAVGFSTLALIKEIKIGWKERLRHLPAALRIISFGLLIVALARPQSFTSGQNVHTEGIDIVMVLDISGSMLAEDFTPNRLEAAKQVIDNFINDRISDRIGLVVFARDAFTQCPLTIDYSVLRNLLAQIKNGMIEDGTAIGNAIANGVNRLKDTDAKGKVMILLTDGVNNAGEIDPVSAAEIATLYGIRIYAIGVGTRGEAPYPVQTPFGIRYQMVPVEIDEELMKSIAQKTGGEYFRATNNRTLMEIYNKIDKLEKSKIEVTSYSKASELFYGWLGFAFLLLVFEFILSSTIFRELP